MASPSIMFADPPPRLADEQPECFPDLNLDQVVGAVTAGREQYDLLPYFYTPLRSVAGVEYRHAVLRDLEQPDVAEQVNDFAERMRQMREHHAQIKKLHYRRQKQAWFLDAVGIYCVAVRDLAGALEGDRLDSAGMRALRDYLTGYIGGARFRTLESDTERLRDALSGIRYCVRIRGDRVTVMDYAEEPDYRTEVLETFDKFKQGAVRDYLVKFADYVEMDHVEAQILDRVAKLNADTFGQLDEFCTGHADYLDPVIKAFDRDVQFYLAWQRYLQRMRDGGLSFCYPQVVDDSKQIRATDTFDIAVAERQVSFHKPLVCNDFELRAGERVFLVTGPNHGGKTTFARAVGQLHYLASLGLPVPGREARLYLPDGVYTHFEKEEDVGELVGKLQDDLIRIHTVLERATPDSLLIMNEIFTSTTLKDARFLGRRILQEVIDRELLAVFVTFVDELATLSDTIVSMVAAVDPKDPAIRTFKLERRPPDGLAYAVAIARKYRLTYEQLKERSVS